MSVELLIQTKIGPFVCARIHLKKRSANLSLLEVLAFLKV